jgi:hypothetical protein
MTPADPQRRGQAPAAEYVRDPFANRAAFLAARQRSMSERLELALSWNLAASQLRNSLANSSSADVERSGS